MKPIDYIYKNLNSFNFLIFVRLIKEAGEEVSVDIFDYLKKTTWNTNPAILKQFGLDIKKTDEKQTLLIVYIDHEGNINESKTGKTVKEVYDFCVEHMDEDGYTDNIIITTSDEYFYCEEGRFISKDESFYFDSNNRWVLTEEGARMAGGVK